jgi:pimeloyl-ACP methyl ester carboxylesterase
MVADLRALLAGAGLPGPYVLVGQSQGVFNALIFASQHPNEVGGLVLVNGAHPDQWTAFQALLPPAAPDEPAHVSRLRNIHDSPADNSERWDLIASAAQVKSALSERLIPLGDLPLAVLTRSPESAMVPFLPPEIAAPGAQVWQDLQSQLAALSSHSTQLFASRAGHNIHLVEPERVAAAIQWVLAEVPVPDL